MEINVNVSTHTNQIEDDMSSAAVEDRDVCDIIERDILEAGTRGLEQILRLLPLGLLRLRHLRVSHVHQVQIVAALLETPFQVFDCADVVGEEGRQLFVHGTRKVFVERCLVL